MNGGEGVRILRVAVILVGLALTAGTSFSRDLPEIVASGELKVLAVEGSETFFNLEDEGQPGLDREILEGFARLHGVTVVPVKASSWKRLIPSLVEGRGDVAAGGVTVTEPRSRVVSFTREVFPTRYVVVSRKPHRVVATVEDLREERVGTIPGTSLAEVVRLAEVPDAQVDDGIQPGGLPEALSSGRVTAVVLGIEDALLLQRDDPDFQIGTALGPAGTLAFAVSQDAPKLLEALDEYLGNLRRTPTWNRLAVEYFGEAALDILRRARDK
jgi:membrane-bound lytic murein transglycosylase F